MAGMISPSDAELLVKLFKKHFNVPVQLHTHFTSGMADLAYLRAIDAGIDVVDCALAPFAMATSQPASEPIVVALESTERDTKIDVRKLVEIGALVEKVAPKYRQFRDTSKVAQIDTGVLIHQIPGGMASNMINQLKQADALHRLHEVHEELPRTRRELGNLPLVTPTSQIVGTQAVMNVLMGRYKMVSAEVKDLCYGLYGKTPTEIDPEVQKICLKGYARGETPITCRPADILEPEMQAAKAKVSSFYAQAQRTGDPSLDHVLVYALYPRTGEAFIRWALGLIEKRPGETEVTLEDVRAEDERIKKAMAGELVEPPPKRVISSDVSTFVVAVGGEVFEVQVEGHGGYGAMPTIRSATPVPQAIRPRPADAPPASVPPPPPSSKPSVALAEGQAAITAPMPGTLIQYFVAVGDTVKEGQAVLTLEAMKMANQLVSPKNGKVVELGPAPGTNVKRGDRLIVIE
jgi:pyruvate carboxylase subunit B